MQAQKLFLHVRQLSRTLKSSQEPTLLDISCLRSSYFPQSTKLLKLALLMFRLQPIRVEKSPSKTFSIKRVTALLLPTPSLNWLIFTSPRAKLKLIKLYHQTKVISLHRGVFRTAIAWHMFSNIFFKGLLAITIGPIYWLVSKSRRQGVQTQFQCALEDLRKLRLACIIAIAK